MALHKVCWDAHLHLAARRKQKDMELLIQKRILAACWGGAATTRPSVHVRWGRCASTVTGVS